MEHENDGDTNYSWCTRYGLQTLGKGTGRVGNRGMYREHPKIVIARTVLILLGLSIDKSPGDLRRLAVSLTLVKD